MDNYVWRYVTDNLSKYKEDICSGIRYVQNYCDSRDYFDEYTYILLWRPVEWMIDFTEYYRFINSASRLTIEGIKEFNEEYRTLSVDNKTARIRQYNKLKTTSSWEKNNIEFIDQLRWARNAVIYHYIEESDKDPFECFDNICKSFIQEFDLEIKYNALSSPTRRIQLSKLSGTYDIDAEQIYLRLKSTIDYICDSKHDKVIAICKMEELVQLMAYKVLKEDLNKKIVYERDGKKAIFVDGGSFKSYIDALTNSLEKMNWLILRKTCQSLKKIREIRNMTMHVISIPDDVEKSYRTVWVETIKNSFGYDDRINRLLDKRFPTKDNHEIVGMLTNCIRYYNKELSHRAVVSIENIVPLISAFVQATFDIDDNYADQLATATKKARSKLEKKKRRELEKRFEEIWGSADESLREKYKEMAIQYFGAAYDTNEETYHCLESALLLYDILGDQTSEYSSICIELTKALEIYLYSKIASKLKEYVKTHPDMNVESVIKDNLENNCISLGNYPYMYPDYDSNNSRDFLAFCKSQNIYPIENDDLLKSELLYEMRKIGEINFNYRKGSAHRDITPEQKMRNCMDEILKGGDIGRKAFLKRVSEAMGDRHE